MAIGFGGDGRPQRRNRDVSSIAENMYFAGASQGFCVVKAEPAVIISVSIVVYKYLDGGVGLVDGNDTRATSSHPRIKPFFYRSVHDQRHTFLNSNALGSLVENTQSQLSRPHPIHQRVLNAFPISCNHVGYAHEVRVQEQSCQGYALVIICLHPSPVQNLSRSGLSSDTAAPRRISS